MFLQCDCFCGGSVACADQNWSPARQFCVGIVRRILLLSCHLKQAGLSICIAHLHMQCSTHQGQAPLELCQKKSNHRNIPISAFPSRCQHIKAPRCYKAYNKIRYTVCTRTPLTLCKRRCMFSSLFNASYDIFTAPLQLAHHVFLH